MLTWTGPQLSGEAMEPVIGLCPQCGHAMKEGDETHYPGCPLITPHILYECGICDCYHPWEFCGDCRDDSNRFGSPEEYAEKLGVTPYDIEVRSMDERVQADLEGEWPG